MDSSPDSICVHVFKTNTNSYILEYENVRLVQYESKHDSGQFDSKIHITCAVARYYDAFNITLYRTLECYYI